MATYFSSHSPLLLINLILLLLALTIHQSRCSFATVGNRKMCTTTVCKGEKYLTWDCNCASCGPVVSACPEIVPGVRNYSGVHNEIADNCKRVFEYGYCLSGSVASKMTVATTLSTTGTTDSSSLQPLQTSPTKGAPSDPDEASSQASLSFSTASIIMIIAAILVAIVATGLVLYFLAKRVLSEGSRHRCSLLASFIKEPPTGDISARVVTGNVENGEDETPLNSSNSSNNIAGSNREYERMTSIPQNYEATEEAPHPYGPPDLPLTNQPPPPPEIPFAQLGVSAASQKNEKHL